MTAMPTFPRSTRRPSPSVRFRGWHFLPGGALVTVVRQMWPFTKKQKSDDLDKKRLHAFGELAIISSLCMGPDRIPVMHGS